MAPYGLKKTYALRKICKLFLHLRMQADGVVLWFS